MSNFGQAALTVVGFGIGLFTGNPMLGLYLGNLAGNALFPTKLPGASGPRISDLQVQTSTIGAPVPKVYGTYLIAGNVIWSSGLNEIATTEEVGGKGGPSQSVTTYEYTVSLAIGLCEGPMAGFKRIWADADLIYDASVPELNGSVIPIDEIDIGGVYSIIGDAYNQFLYQQAQNNALTNNLEFYTGSETQLPDPTIESYEGVGNVPAYRGLCYIVLRNFNVTKYGNRIPNFRFEVFDNGSSNADTVTQRTNEVLYEWLNSDYPVNPLNRHEVSVGYCPGVYGGNISGTFETVEGAISEATERSGRTFNVYSGYCNNGVDNNRTGRTNRIGLAPTFDERDGVTISLLYSQRDYTAAVRRRTGVVGDFAPSTGFGIGVSWWSNNSFVIGSWGGGGGVYRGYPIQLQNTVGTPEGWDFYITGSTSYGFYWIVDKDLMLRVERVPREPPSPSELGGRALDASNDWWALPDGSIVPGAVWTRQTGTCKVLQRYSVDSTVGGKPVVAKYPIGPALLPSDANYDDSAYWTAQYQRAVAEGKMEAGLVYDVDYPATQNYYYERNVALFTSEGAETSLADIVDRISASIGITDADVSDLESITVKGYAITRAMSARDAIEPLRSYGFFDAVESNGIAKFVTRGKTAVATLSADDLATHSNGEARPPAVDISRVQDVELPVQLRVHYPNPARDYEPLEQYASRITTQSKNRVDVELAIAMDDDRAAQIADVLLYEAWTARMSYRFTLGLEWLRLDPADVVNLPVGDRVERVRIQNINFVPPALLQLEGVRDDAAVYDSSALGVPGQGTGSSFNYTGPTELVLLDIPAIRDADDDAGFYAAARPIISVSTWRGAALYRSTDNGSSYSLIGSITSQAIMGELTADSGSADATIVDEVGEIYVRVFNGELESRTEDAVLSGANAAAIGDHGRWEIIQFKNAELVEANVWKLTSLRRGRRGTEHNIGEALAGDKFVLLSAGGLVRIYQENASIGASRQYKAITFGAVMSSEDEVQNFAGAGEALKPFSPVFVEAVREGDGDIRLTWIRRGRLSQELRDGAEIPLSEASESYQVDVLDGTTVLRTISSTSELALYTLAQQQSDFGSPLPTSIAFRVYQMSAVVGRGYPAEVTIAIEDEQDYVSGQDQFDFDAIILTGETKDSDEADLLTWSVQGSGTRRSDRGFVGDGYEFRIKANSGLPAWLAAGSAQAITLRATVEPYWGVRHATADRLVSLCNDDATANPKLELALVSDPTDTYEFMTAVRAFTGSMQTQRIARRNWRYHWQFPVKVSGGFQARPQSLCHLSNGTMLVSGHYQDNFSIAYQCLPNTGEVIGSFEFDSSTAYHVNSLARRESDDTVWFDGDDRILRRLNVDSSLTTGDAVVDFTFNCTNMVALSGIEWVQIDDEEYLLLGEYQTSGTPYLYVISAEDVVNGATFVLADRVKRMALPLRCQGFAYRDGILWLSCSVAPSGGRLYPILFDDFLSSGTDGSSYTSYLERPETSCPRPPTAYAQDVKFDSNGRLWTMTEGLSGVDDADEFNCVWSTALGEYEENTYQVRYNGAGSVEIKVNDNLFVTRSWTPNVTPGAISVLGPPTGTASQTGGFACARVHNVVIQESDLALEDYEGDLVSYSNRDAVGVELSFINANAEEAVGTEWTVSLGAMTRQSNSGFNYSRGSFHFWGDTNAQSIATQRVDLRDVFDTDFSDLETDYPSRWLVAEWLTSSWPAQSDRMDLSVKFYDVNGTIISTSAAPSFFPDRGSDFVYRSFGMALPAGTVFVEVYVDMIRLDGTNNNAQWDELKVTFYGAQ